MTQVKRNLAITLSSLAFIFCGVQGAMANNNSAIELFKKAELEGLSLQSTADDIKSYVAARPNLNCRHTDVPERKSKMPHRASQPAEMGWHCIDPNPKTSAVLNVKMVAGHVILIDHQLRYEILESQQSAMAKIKQLHAALKQTGLGDKQADKRNYTQHEENDVSGASEAIYMQDFKAEVTPQCGNFRVQYKLSMSSSKIPAQGVYGAAFKIERSRDHLHCSE